MDYVQGTQIGMVENEQKRKKRLEEGLAFSGLSDFLSMHVMEWEYQLFHFFPIEYVVVFPTVDNDHLS